MQRKEIGFVVGHGNGSREADRAEAKAYLDFLGISREELETVPSSTYLDPRDREETRRLMEKLQSGEIPNYHLERRYIRKDGEERWAEVVTSAIRDSNNEWLATVTIVNDITERKQAEEALTASKALLAEREAYYRTIFENSGSGIFSRSRDWKTTRANKQFLEFGPDTDGFNRAMDQRKMDITHDLVRSACARSSTGSRRPESPIRPPPC